MMSRLASSAPHGHRWRRRRREDERAGALKPGSARPRPPRRQRRRSTPSALPGRVDRQEHVGVDPVLLSISPLPSDRRLPTACASSTTRCAPDARHNSAYRPSAAPTSPSMLKSDSTYDKPLAGSGGLLESVRDGGDALCGKISRRAGDKPDAVDQASHGSARPTGSDPRARRTWSETARFAR